MVPKLGEPTATGETPKPQKQGSSYEDSLEGEPEMPMEAFDLAMSPLLFFWSPPPLPVLLGWIILYILVSNPIEVEHVGNEKSVSGEDAGLHKTQCTS